MVFLEFLDYQDSDARIEITIFSTRILLYKCWLNDWEVDGGYWTCGYREPWVQTSLKSDDSYIQAVCSASFESDNGYL